MTKVYKLDVVLEEALKIAAADYRGMDNPDLEAQIEEWKERAKANVTPVWEEKPSFKGRIWIRRRPPGTTEKGVLLKSKIYTNRDWFERMWIRRCREVGRSSQFRLYEEFAIAFEMDADGKWVETRRYERGKS